MITLNGTLFKENREINQETILLSVAFQKYYCEIVFDVVDMANYNIVLGILWLKKYRPRIDWKQEIIRLGYNYIIGPIPLHQLNAVEDKKKNKKLPEENAISNPYNKYSKKQNSGMTATRIR